MAEMSLLPIGVDYTDLAAGESRTRCYSANLHGTDTPLVLLHGAGADSALISYAGVLTSFAPHRRVVAPDLPGYGASALPPGAVPDIGWYVDWVEHLCRAMGLDRIDLGGLSLGGFIALQTALDRPGLVRRLVLINPAGLSETLPWMWWRDGWHTIHGPTARQCAPRSDSAVPQHGWDFGASSAIEPP
ncbi:alpha/beta fold hydrolase [Nocardia sp. 2]|uniref:Alpha/beta fold hydrolase n=1 Tax=Nocardia acididurans TaxID=2802282 RepID=A0ABS1M9S2_9NOCA|nr:alpha/beta fold hydrolase [Nocardia acididurans]MBL1076969.1 alpha/beta fold hydrolase [Nocardia acididurans]